MQSLSHIYKWCHTSQIRIAFQGWRETAGLHHCLEGRRLATTRAGMREGVKIVWTRSIWEGLLSTWAWMTEVCRFFWKINHPAYGEGRRWCVPGPGHSMITRPGLFCSRAEGNAAELFWWPDEADATPHPNPSAMVQGSRPCASRCSQQECPFTNREMASGGPVRGKTGWGWLGLPSASASDYLTASKSPLML